MGGPPACVEEVTLCDVDAFCAQLMDQLQDAGGDDCFAAGGGVGKRAVGLAVLENNAVQLCNRQEGKRVKQGQAAGGDVSSRCAMRYSSAEVTEQRQLRGQP